MSPVLDVRLISVDSTFHKYYSYVELNLISSQDESHTNAAVILDITKVQLTSTSIIQVPRGGVKAMLVNEH